MAKMVDASDLKSDGANRGGSIPSARTNGTRHVPRIEAAFGCWLPPHFAHVKGYDEPLYVVTAFDNCDPLHSVQILVVTESFFMSYPHPPAVIDAMWATLANDLHNAFVECHRR